MLWRGRITDVVPTDFRDREGIARILGLDAHHGYELGEDYQRRARRARVVTERLFYGATS